MGFLISNKDYSNDCRLLFGSNIGQSYDFLKGLLQSELKSAYRKRAFETHPDRAKVLGKPGSEMDERFREVSMAFERLDSYVQNHKGRVRNYGVVNRKKNKETTQCDKKRKDTSDHFYKGNIPGKKLLTAQFLYYSGLISWETFIKAIIWQRRQRPLVGKIALGWHMLSEDDINKILKDKDCNERFCESALHKGYINHFEFAALIGKQRMLQRPIGEYFIQRKIFCTEEMDKMIKSLHKHNKEAFK